MLSRWDGRGRPAKFAHYDVTYPNDSEVRDALPLPQNSCSNAVGHAVDL